MPKRSRDGTTKGSRKRAKTSTGSSKKKKPRSKSASRRRSKGSKGVSKAVKAFVAHAVDARTPDTRIVLKCGPTGIPRQWNGTERTEGDTTLIPVNTHFFLHEPYDAKQIDRTPGMNIPEQLGLRHLENAANIKDLTLGQLTGTNVKVKSIYVKGRYFVNQTQMVNYGLTSLYIRTLCLMHKEKSYEELKSQANTPLYKDGVSETAYNLNAGINYVINNDVSGWSTENREDRTEAGYEYPNELKLCRSFPDLYSMRLPLNKAAFKVLGKSVKKAKVANYKPLTSVEGFLTNDRSNGASLSEYIFTPDANGNVAKYFSLCPSGGTWEIPFSMKIKHPKHLRWDNTHRRLTLQETQGDDPFTSGPQNFTPFLMTHLFSENPTFSQKLTPEQSAGLNNIITADYKIYLTLDAQPSI